MKTITYHVEGMMCAHCEKTVKRTLEALPGVSSAIANANENSVTLSINEDVSIELIQKALKEAGYELIQSKLSNTLFLNFSYLILGDTYGKSFDHRLWRRSHCRYQKVLHRQRSIQRNLHC